MHVFTSITHIFPLLLVFLYSFFLSFFLRLLVFFSFSLFFYLSCLPFFSSSLPFLCVRLWPFYTACHDKICHFYPLNTFSLLWVSFQDYPLVCQLPNHYHYTMLVCIRLVISAHVYLFWVKCPPSRTFSPKEFEQKPQKRLPLLPTARPYPLLPLTPWLDTSKWCLSLVCMLHFRLNSLLFLALMRLSLPLGLSNFATRSSVCVTLAT